MPPRHFIARDDLLTYRQVYEQYGIPIGTLEHAARSGHIRYETPAVGRPVKKFRRSVVMSWMQVHEPRDISGGSPGRKTPPDG